MARKRRQRALSACTLRCVTSATLPAPTSTGPALLRVRTCSGQWLEVQGKPEKDFFDSQRDKYQAENSFTAVTDLQDLDRLLFLELLVYRSTVYCRKS